MPRARSPLVFAVALTWLLFLQPSFADDSAAKRNAIREAESAES